jgi:hypothetical protein
MVISVGTNATDRLPRPSRAVPDLVPPSLAAGALSLAAGVLAPGAADPVAPLHATSIKLSMMNTAPARNRVIGLRSSIPEKGVANILQTLGR